MKPVYETFYAPNKKNIINFHKDYIVRETQSANWHKPLEVLYVVSGEGKISCNFKPYYVKGGDIIIVNSNFIHQLSSLSEMTVFCLIIDHNFCSENGISVEETYFTEIIQDKKANSLFEDIIEEQSCKDSFFHVSVSVSVIKLLVYLARNYSRQDLSLSSNTNSVKYQRVQKAIEYIEQHYNEKLTVEKIAESVHVSKFYLSHEFKRITGRTVNEMINIIKCTHAQKLLSDNNLTATKISDMCGFENYAYFSNVFKKVVGISPSEYRNNIQKINK